MIMLTRLSGSAFVLNADLIERLDATPDTVVTLVDGKKYVVAEADDRGRRRWSAPGAAASSPRARCSASTRRSTLPDRPTWPPVTTHPARWRVTH